jgi:hypothetical protein
VSLITLPTLPGEQSEKIVIRAVQIPERNN